jgi:hypothetical protein
MRFSGWLLALVLQESGAPKLYVLADRFTLLVVTERDKGRRLPGLIEE